MSNLHAPDKITDLPLSIIQNMITLSTSGFGVVVALAWNSLVQKIVSQYLDPWLGQDGSMISLLIYAIAMTILAVLVTMQLASLEKKFSSLNEKLKQTQLLPSHFRNRGH